MFERRMAWVEFSNYSISSFILGFDKDLGKLFGNWYCFETLRIFNSNKFLYFIGTILLFFFFKKILQFVTQFSAIEKPSELFENSNL
jgi:hypothetical protein